MWRKQCIFPIAASIPCIIWSQISLSSYVHSLNKHLLKHQIPSTVPGLIDTRESKSSPCPHGWNLATGYDLQFQRFCTQKTSRQQHPLPFDFTGLTGPHGTHHPDTIIVQSLFQNSLASHVFRYFSALFLCDLHEYCIKHKSSSTINNTNVSHIGSF